VVVNVVVVDAWEEVDEEVEEEVDEEVEQGNWQGSWEVSELVVVATVELLTSLYGKTPRIGAVVVESSCLFILILESVVGNS